MGDIPGQTVVNLQTQTAPPANSMAGVAADVGKTDFNAMSDAQVKQYAGTLHEKVFANLSGQQLQAKETEVLQNIDKLKAEGKLNEEQAQAMKNVFQNSENEEGFTSSIVANRAALQSIPATTLAAASPAKDGKQSAFGGFDLSAMQSMGPGGIIMALLAFVGMIRGGDMGAFSEMFKGMGNGGGNVDQRFNAYNAQPSIGLSDALKQQAAPVEPGVKSIIDTMYKYNAEGKPAVFNFSNGDSYLVTKNTFGGTEIRDVDGKNVSGAQVYMIEGGSPERVAAMDPNDVRLVTREFSISIETTPQTMEDRLMESAGKGAVFVQGKFPENSLIEYKGGHIDTDDLNGKKLAVSREANGTYSISVEQKIDSNTTNVTTYNGIDKLDLPPEMQREVNSAFAVAGAQQERDLAQQSELQRNVSARASAPT